jgi:hypothetical protein
MIVVVVVVNQGPPYRRDVDQVLLDQFTLLIGVT